MKKARPFTSLVILMRVKWFKLKWYEVQRFDIFYRLWSLKRFSTLSPALVGRCRCFKSFASGDPMSKLYCAKKRHHFDYWFFMLNSKAVLGHQEHRECKERWQCREDVWLGEVTVAILDFLSPPKISQNFFVWHLACFSKATCSFLPLLSVYILCNHCGMATLPVQCKIKATTAQPCLQLPFVWPPVDTCGHTSDFGNLKRLLLWSQASDLPDRCSTCWGMIKAVVNLWSPSP